MQNSKFEGRGPKTERSRGPKTEAGTMGSFGKIRDFELGTWNWELARRALGFVSQISASVKSVCICGSSPVGNLKMVCGVLPVSRSGRLKPYLCSCFSGSTRAHACCERRPRRSLCGAGSHPMVWVAHASVCSARARNTARGGACAPL